MKRGPALLLLFLCACAGNGSPRPAHPREPGPAVHAPWAGGTVLPSNDSSYRVVYKIAREPIPRGEPFALDAWVFAADAPDRPLADVSLAADAAMPQHGHGMNRVARVVDLGGGHFRVEGLLFHMSGQWELYLDVTSGARTERAQAQIDLD